MPPMTVVHVDEYNCIFINLSEGHTTLNTLINKINTSWPHSVVSQQSD